MAERLETYKYESGVDRVDLLAHVPGLPHEALRQTLTLFANEVAPRMGVRCAGPAPGVTGLPQLPRNKGSAELSALCRARRSLGAPEFRLGFIRAILYAAYTRFNQFQRWQTCWRSGQPR